MKVDRVAVVPPSGQAGGAPFARHHLVVDAAPSDGAFRILPPSDDSELAVAATTSVDDGLVEFEPAVEDHRGFRWHRLAAGCHGEFHAGGQAIRFQVSVFGANGVVVNAV